jgi:hypothetical protein
MDTWDFGPGLFENFGGLFRDSLILDVGFLKSLNGLPKFSKSPPQKILLGGLRPPPGPLNNNPVGFLDG